MEWGIIIGAIFAVFMGLAERAKKKKKTKLQKEQCAAYSAEIDSIKKSFLTGSGIVSVPVLNAADFGYRPVAKENLLAIQNGVTRMEMKSTGRHPSEKSWQATACGRLLVTDKAIVFEGVEKNERLTWAQVANLEVLLDGFTISKRSGLPRTYQIDRPDATFAAVVEFMLVRTA